jgi:hypothetical protein
VEVGSSYRQGRRRQAPRRVFLTEVKAEEALGDDGEERQPARERRRRELVLSPVARVP